MALCLTINHNLFLEEVMIDGTIKYIPDGVVQATSRSQAPTYRPGVVLVFDLCPGAKPSSTLRSVKT